MSDLVLPVNAGSLASGFCPSTYQELANALASIYSVTLAQGTGVTWVFSATKPTDTSVGWFQLDSFGRPMRPYLFAQGAWLALHPLVPGMTMIWTSALPDFTTFDGGDANVLSAISGPMWEEVTALRAKFPIGVGTLPSGTVLAVGDTGGEEKHTLLSAEMPPHRHQMFGSDKTTDTTLDAAHSPARRRNVGNEEDYKMANSDVDATLGQTGLTGGDGVSVTTAHNNLPVFYTVYFLRRTARLFYSVP